MGKQLTTSNWCLLSFVNPPFNTSAYLIYQPIVYHRSVLKSPDEQADQNRNINVKFSLLSNAKERPTELNQPKKLINSWPSLSKPPVSSFDVPIITIQKQSGGNWDSQ